MSDGRKADPARLRRLLSANDTRLRRAEIEKLATRVAAVAARRCDRFSLHKDDPFVRDTERWLESSMPPFGPFTDEEPFDRCLAQRVQAAIDAIVGRHRLTGWCVIIAGSGYPEFPPAIGADASDVAGLADDLVSEIQGSYGDAWIACREGRWCIKVFHEGWAQLWKAT